jgi:energy-coupling factor transporter ATP-binding protein EcfA2
LICLAEPTSGLDSATSISLLHSLHQLSSIGVNIVATLHQPRQEILDLIDTLILLAPGGRLAYFGPPSELREHFSGFGYTCPTNSNVADFVMDVLAGFIAPAGKASAPPVKETLALLCDAWTRDQQPLHDRYLQDEFSEIMSETRVLSTFHEHSNVSVVVDGQSRDLGRSDQISLSDRLFNLRKTLYVSFSRQKKVNKYFMGESIVVVSGVMLTCVADIQSFFREHHRCIVHALGSRACGWLHFIAHSHERF